jgi:hypothetical protein
MLLFTTFALLHHRKRLLLVFYNSANSNAHLFVSIKSAQLRRTQRRNKMGSLLKLAQNVLCAHKMTEHDFSAVAGYLRAIHHTESREATRAPVGWRSRNAGHGIGMSIHRHTLHTGMMEAKHMLVDLLSFWIGDSLR